MNQNVSVPLTQQERQETFWAWTDGMMNQLVTGLAERVLELELEARLRAGWNQRIEGRCDYRNGHYRRWLTTPHGPVRLKVPRCTG